MGSVNKAILVGNLGRDAEVTRCLDTRVFYVCPRLNPDGAEWALADVPRLIRSSTRPYPHDEEPVGGNRGGDGAQVVRFFEREHAGKADVQTQIEELGGLLGCAGERVHDAG